MSKIIRLFSILLLSTTILIPSSAQALLRDTPWSAPPEGRLKKSFFDTAKNIFMRIINVEIGVIILQKSPPSLRFKKCEFAANLIHHACMHRAHVRARRCGRRQTVQAGCSERGIVLHQTHLPTPRVP